MYLFNATLMLVGPVGADAIARGKGPVVLRRRAQAPAAAQWGRRTELPREGPVRAGCPQAQAASIMMLRSQR